jgi:hypothetical protein
LGQPELQTAPFHPGADPALLGILVIHTQAGRTLYRTRRSTGPSSTRRGHDAIPVPKILPDSQTAETAAFRLAI